MKKINLLVTAAALLAVVQGEGRTVVWYRFNAADGTTVVNAANPGTHDGTIKSIEAWNGSYVFGTTAENYPVYGEAMFGNGAGVWDPVSETYRPTHASLHWTKTVHPGLVVTDYSDDLPQRNMTIEAFVRFPPEAAARTSPDAALMHPIAQLGIDCTSGWMFSVYKGQPFFRWCAKTTSGACSEKKPILNPIGNNPASSLGTSFTLYDGKWHHIAATIDNTGYSRLYLDYAQIAGAACSATDGKDADGNWIGLYLRPDKDKLVLGVNQTYDKRSLYGEIGEVRLSETALTFSQFLRPVAAGPVNAETDVYLALGDCDWFGQPIRAGYLNRCWGAINASTNATAPRAEWHYPSFEPENLPTVEGHPEGMFLRQATVPEGVKDDDAGYVRFANQYWTITSTTSYVGAVVKLSNAGTPLSDGDFTLEWFFKSDEIPLGYPEAQVLFECAWAKIMINNDGCFYNRLITTDNKDKNYQYTAKRVDDGNWHHYALVYRKDRRTYEFYLDHRKLKTETFAAGVFLKQETDKYIGGRNNYRQVFAGAMDNFRITRRALAAYEFQTRADYVSDMCLNARFEGDLSTGQSAVIAPDGIGGSENDRDVPSYAAVNFSIDADNDGVQDYVSLNALKLDGGFVKYPPNALLEQRNLTVEFFAKFTAIGNNAPLFRLGRIDSYDQASQSGILSWGVYCPGVPPDGLYVRLGIRQSADGSWAASTRKDYDFIQNQTLADGKWHHWAFTFATDETSSPKKTVVTCYRDYAVLGTPVALPDGILLAIPEDGTSFSFGGGGGLVGYLDEYRVRSGVCAVDTFMRRLPNGSVLLVR